MAYAIHKNLQLSTLVIVDANGAFAVQAMGPEAFDGSGSALTVCEQEPETKDGFGQDVEDSVSNDLLVNRHLAAAVTNTPYDWVQSPEDEGEASNGGEELGCLGVLGHDGTAAGDGELPDDDQVSNATDGIIAPLLSSLVAESGKEPSQDHDDIGHNRNEDIGAAQACQEGQVKQEQWSGQGPVDITSPEDLAVNVCEGVWNAIPVCVLEDNVGKRVSITSGHGEVGDGRKGSDESGQDVEETLLHRDSPCHADESNGGQKHKNKDYPEGLLSGIVNNLIMRLVWEDSWERSHGGSGSAGWDKQGARRHGESLHWVDHVYSGGADGVKLSTCRASSICDEVRLPLN